MSFSYISVDWIWSSCKFLVQFSSRPELCVTMYWSAVVCIGVWDRSCGRVVHKFLTWWGASGYIMFYPSLVLLSSSASVITWQVNSDPGSSIIWYCQVVPSATTSMTERSDISRTCVPNHFQPPANPFRQNWQKMRNPSMNLEWLDIKELGLNSQWLLQHFNKAL